MSFEKDEDTYEGSLLQVAQLLLLAIDIHV